jgi:hypothetical protein
VAQWVPDEGACGLEDFFSKPAKHPEGDQNNFVTKLV